MFSREEIETAIETVTTQIEETAKQYNRDVQNVTLVAVSKTFPAEHIRPALEKGLRVFGENRVQEGQQKWPELKADFANVELHLIGPLQTNKVKQAMDHFDVIETLDRKKLADHLARERDVRDGLCPSLFIQINTGEEDQKAGIMPDHADEFIRYCLKDLKLPVVGLMCIPPVDAEPALHFALLRKIAANHGLEKLSMGMSADFQTAIQFDATHIRLGSALFGPRPQKQDVGN